jgi:predicted transcriptional regulator of viral defense system
MRFRPKPGDRPSASARLLVAKLAREAKAGLISVAEAADALDMSRRDAALKLAALARTGWLRRVRRGLYLVAPLEAEPGRLVTPEDPWVLAREAFSPCYIGGWSAAEYWGLTEQLFRATLVVTASHTRESSVRLLGYEFRLFRVDPSRIEGATLVWRNAERVPVSDRERTLIDCLRHPELCGGIRHLADMLREYRESDEYAPAKLLATARKAANGAAWKRLGYLAEILWPGEDEIFDEARMRMTAGKTKLDPDVRKRGTLVTRWRLWVNVPIEGRPGNA